VARTKDEIVTERPTDLMALTIDLSSGQRANVEDRHGPTNLDFCKAEAARINQIPGRRAVVFIEGKPEKGTCALYVNRVAGTPLDGEA
jgi:hypothetical protein